MLIITFSTDESMRLKSEGAAVVETLNFGGQGVCVWGGGSMHSLTSYTCMDTQCLT